MLPINSQLELKLTSERSGEDDKSFTQVKVPSHMKNEAEPVFDEIRCFANDLGLFSQYSIKTLRAVI